MQNIKHISIPKSCQQAEWQNMIANSKGRYCNACCKTVIDFTLMSNEQIIDTFSTSQKICGRFTRTQLDGLNNSISITKVTVPFWKKWAIAAAVLFFYVPAHKTAAQIKPLISLQPTKRDTTNTKADTITYKTITGRVTASNDGLPRPGVILMIANPRTITQTNANGDFSITLPSKTKELQVLYLGYQTQKLILKSTTDKYFKVTLRPSAAIMGEVVIQPHN